MGGGGGGLIFEGDFNHNRKRDSKQSSSGTSQNMFCSNF